MSRVCLCVRACVVFCLGLILYRQECLIATHLSNFNLGLYTYSLPATQTLYLYIYM